MRNKIRNILTAFLLLALLISSTPQSSTSANPPPYTMVDLTPSWTTGIISEAVGLAGIIAADFNQDGKVDIASCSVGYAYVLNYLNDGTYDTTWYSNQIHCQKIAAADRDFNGISELYVATGDGKVLIIDTADYQLIDEFSLVSGMVAADIAVGDVDGDNALEIVLACSDATLVYDATSFDLEWQATGLGGFEVAIGNLDDDPINEIVVNSGPAHILNASEKIQEWAYSGGFGAAMDIGDVEGDNRAEIAYVDDWYNAYVIEGDTRTIKWQLNDLFESDAVAVADVDANGVSEVLIGDGQWGNVTGYQGSNGAYLWAIPNSEHGVTAISVGDANNDGVNEIIWGAGFTSSGNDALNVGSWVTQSVQWGSDDPDSPLYVAANDIDLDGQGEIVMASRNTTGTFAGGTIRVYDGSTHQVEWSILAGESLFDVYQMNVGQLDLDGALEIIVSGEDFNSTYIYTYDGISRSLEWQSPALAYGAPPAMTLGDLNNDSVDEIIIGLYNKHVQVYQAGSDAFLWDSGPLNGEIEDLAVGDLDGNGITEYAILTSQNVYVYEAGTWTQKLNRPLPGGRNLTIAEADLATDGRLILVTSDVYSNRTIQAWDGTDFSVKWQRALGIVLINDLVSADLDLDGIRELILLGKVGSWENEYSVLWIASQSYPFFWEYKNTVNWGSITSMAFSDVDTDGQAEFLFGSSNLIQVDEISSYSKNIYQTNLAMIRRECFPIYSDDFSNPGSGWPNTDTGNVLFGYTNGEYRILVRPTWYGAGARPGVRASDYFLSVDVRNQTGVMGSYGLVFGLDQYWNTFYTLEIYPDGWYGIYRYDPNNLVALSEGYSSSIYQGTATNHLKLERNGATINAYANGTLLASISDSYYIGNRYLGLIVFSYDQPNVDIRFDNYMLETLGCGGSNSSLLILDGGQLMPEYQFDNYDLLSKIQHPIP